mmetsp:Transcript_27461/g.64088  ORF Transcript_27461/g.64088 Transcript_27461/m.64088 type:complete len:293 (-) Transcript_27461:1117-1995(-)
MLHPRRQHFQPVAHIGRRREALLLHQRRRGQHHHDPACGLEDDAAKVQWRRGRAEDSRHLQPPTAGGEDSERAGHARGGGHTAGRGERRRAERVAAAARGGRRTRRDRREAARRIVPLRGSHAHHLHRVRRQEHGRPHGELLVCGHDDRAARQGHFHRAGQPLEPHRRRPARRTSALLAGRGQPLRVQLVRLLALAALRRSPHRRRQDCGRPLPPRRLAAPCRLQALRAGGDARLPPRHGVRDAAAAGSSQGEAQGAREDHGHPPPPQVKLPPPFSPRDALKQGVKSHRPQN